MKFHYKYLDEFLGRQFKFKIKKNEVKVRKKGKTFTWYSLYTAGFQVMLYVMAMHCNA